jgi:cation diffusion facilitator CzcD-associated flavoprotein CzcO
VQVIPALAETAERLYVFQRTPNFSVPAHNGAIDTQQLAAFADDVAALRRQLTAHPAGILFPLSGGKSATDYDPDAQRALMEERWAFGGHTMNTVFSDQGTKLDANAVVVDFFHDKIRARVHDPAVAERLMPTRYPLGARRLCLDSGYYETFNRPNVELVDIQADPIERITADGVQTRDNHYELDLLVFAIGFEAFTGSLDQANIRNEKGERPTDRWTRGPLTHLGLMTHGFPNLFIVTGPGSPSLLANMFLANMQHIDLIIALLTHMRENGYTAVEPTEKAERQWSDRLAELAGPLIRLQVDNFMVHVNADDKSRVFIPYAGGFGQYDEDCAAVIENDFEGFDFR